MNLATEILGRKIDPTEIFPCASVANSTFIQMTRLKHAPFVQGLDQLMIPPGRAAEKQEER
jgi:hypothetical protein